jgi:hypothetical protein
MRVIYKKPILVQLHDVIYEAKLQRKEIDYFELMEKEWHDLRKALGLPFLKGSKHFITVLGVEVRIVEDDSGAEI